MAQCGVPTAAWPFACGDVDLNNGLHWDDATNKFWVEPGLSTTATALAWPYTANIDAANPTGNGLHWDAAKCKPWVQPESNTNHTVAALSSAFAPALGDYWRPKNGPFIWQWAIHWYQAWAERGQRNAFEIIRQQDSIMTVTNTSSKSRSISATVDFPQIVHYVTWQSPWCVLIGQLFYEVYQTSLGPTGVWTTAFGQVQNGAFTYDPNTATTNTGAVDYPFSPNYGGGTYGSGWQVPTGTVFPSFQAGGYGLYAKYEQMGSLNWIGASVPVGHSIRMTYNVLAFPPFDPDAAIKPGGVPDVPYVASYTSVINSGVLNAVMV